MRVVAIRAHGGLDQLKLEDWPEPVAAPGQAVVEVKACGLNYLDVFVMRGMPGLPVEMPRIPGGDISGVVRAVGQGVSSTWIGGRVLIDPYIQPGATAGFDPRTDIRYIWRREVNIVGCNGWTRSDLEQLLEEVARGSILPIIDRVYPLEEAAHAMRMLEDRDVFGKVLVRP